MGLKEAEKITNCIGSPEFEAALTDTRMLSRRNFWQVLAVGATAYLAGGREAEANVELRPDIEKLFSSPQMRPPEGSDAEQRILFWQEKYTDNLGLLAGFKKMAESGDLTMVLQACATEGVPKEVVCLALAESHWNPQARSRKGALGPWQFMPGTARDYGLRVGGPNDERMDKRKSTEKAMKLLKDNYELTFTWDKEIRDPRFRAPSETERWQFAMWSYNFGPGNVKPYYIRTLGNPDMYASLCVNIESRNFVPKIWGIYMALSEYHSIDPDFSGVTIGSAPALSPKTTVRRPERRGEKVFIPFSEQISADVMRYQLPPRTNVADIALLLSGDPKLASQVHSQIRVLNPNNKKTLDMFAGYQILTIPGNIIKFPEGGLDELLDTYYPQLTGDSQHKEAAKKMFYQLNYKKSDYIFTPGEDVIVPVVPMS